MCAIQEMLSWLFDPNKLVAVSTTGIFVFTIVLAVVTRRQAILTRDALKLARDEFLSTHRPEISIISTETTYDGTDAQLIGLRIVYVNKGLSEARNLEIWATISIREFPFQSGIRPHGPSIAKHPVLSSGMKDYVSVESTVSQSDAWVDNSVRLRGHDSQGRPVRGGVLICIGCIAYEDGLGNRRETGFCRFFSVDTDAWKTIENSEYEYAY